MHNTKRCGETLGFFFFLFVLLCFFFSMTKAADKSFVSFDFLFLSSTVLPSTAHTHTHTRMHTHMYRHYWYRLTHTPFLCFFRAVPLLRINYLLRIGWQKLVSGQSIKNSKITAHYLMFLMCGKRKSHEFRARHNVDGSHTACTTSRHTPHICVYLHTRMNGSMHARFSVRV